jgi:ATP-dependent DNA helicase RecQ
MGPKTLTNVVYQLVERGLLDRTPGDRPLLKLNAASWAVLRGQRCVRLVLPKQRVVKATQIQAESWAGVDRGLFESLRELRRTIADERGVPAFVVFGDAALRDMARRRPQTPAEFRTVHGVVEQKLKSFGERFLARIAAHSGRRSGEPM